MYLFNTHTGTPLQFAVHTLLLKSMLVTGHEFNASHSTLLLNSTLVTGREFNVVAQYSQYPLPFSRKSSQYSQYHPSRKVHSTRSTPQPHPNRSHQLVHSTRSTPPTALAEKFTVPTVPPLPLLAEKITVPSTPLPLTNIFQ